MIVYGDFFVWAVVDSDNFERLIFKDCVVVGRQRGGVLLGDCADRSKKQQHEKKSSGHLQAFHGRYKSIKP